MKSRANQITTNVVRMANLQGCDVWRTNVVGVFDIVAAVDKVWKLIQGIRATTKEIKQVLQSCYKTTGDRKGVSDIIGLSPTGRFIAIEIKAKGDQLDKDQKNPFRQENFLKEVGQKGGIAFIVAEEPQKIRLKVFGSEKFITICDELEFLPLLRQKLAE